MLPNGDINPGEMTSFNHYALGSVAAWMHRVIGGISPQSPGWRQILIQPRPGGSITHASIKHASPYGIIRCDWRVVDETIFEMEIEIPPNCTGQVLLPGTTKQERVGSGVHKFESSFQAESAWPPKAIQFAFAPPKPDNPL